MKIPATFLSVPLVASPIVRYTSILFIVSTDKPQCDLLLHSTQHNFLLTKKKVYIAEVHNPYSRSTVNYWDLRDLHILNSI